MTYFSVWLVQAVATFAWMKWVSDTPMSFHEFTAGTWFSAAALFTHWACHRWNRPCKSQCSGCPVACIRAAKGGGK